MDLISITRRSGFKFQVGVRGHEITADLPESYGGGDEGPMPSELLAGSLGLCIAMTVQGYCERHGYDGDVGVSLTLEMADKPKRIDRIVVDLELPESVPEDKKEVILRVAHRCPIHETLKTPPGLDIDIV